MNLFKKAIARVKMAEVALTAGIDQSGQDMVEYALIVSLIGLGTVVAMQTMADYITNAINTVGSVLTSAVGA